MQVGRVVCKLSGRSLAILIVVVTATQIPSFVLGCVRAGWNFCAPVVGSCVQRGSIVVTFPIVSSVCGC